jgi:hypothetical protein
VPGDLLDSLRPRPLNRSQRPRGPNGSPTACSRNLTLAIRPRTWSGLGALAVLVEPIGGPSAGEGYKPNSRSIAPVSRRFGIL